jgi:hypothetical protein
MKVTVVDKAELRPCVSNLPDGATFTLQPDGSVFLKVRRPKSQSSHINRMLEGYADDMVPAVSLRQGNFVLLDGATKVFPVDAEVLITSKHGTPREGD